MPVSLSRFGGARVAVLLAAAGLLAAACSSSSDESSGPPPTSSAHAMVTVVSGPLGSYLADADGRTLYMFSSDTASRSTCSGECASVWPPLISTGAPAAGTGAKATELGTISRGDGKTQVTYHGHPLYYFSKDDEADDTYGQGVHGFGATWWVVGADGQPITKMPATSSSGSGGGGSGGGGGGGGGGGY